MRPSQALEAHREAIRRIVAENHSANPRVFGSVVYGEDSEGSDLDILVESSGMTLMDLAHIENQLQDLMGISVDVLTPGFLPPHLRDKVISEAVPV